MNIKLGWVLKDKNVLIKSLVLIGRKVASTPRLNDPSPPARPYRTVRSGGNAYRAGERIHPVGQALRMTSC